VLNKQIGNSTYSVAGRKLISNKANDIRSLENLESLNIKLDFLFKRISDIIVSLILLIVSDFPTIAIALLIKSDSSGPVFFRQTRVGLKGTHSQVWKFRTTVQNASQLQEQLGAKNGIDGRILFKIKKDPRVIKIGQHFA